MANSQTEHSKKLRQRAADGRRARILATGGKRVSPIILEKEYAVLWADVVRGQGGNNTEALRKLLANHRAQADAYRLGAGKPQSIGDTPNLGVAMETMAAFMGYLNAAILAEQHTAEPSPNKIAALDAMMGLIGDERGRFGHDPLLVDKALHIYAPLMKAVYATGHPDTAWLTKR